MKKLILFFLTAVLLCGCAVREEQAVPEYVLTYAENQPQDYPTTRGAEYFAQLVEARTGGRIVVQVLCDARMGTQREVLDQLAFGGVDFTRVSLSSISDELPVLNVLQLPFLYEDAEHLWRVLDGPIGEEFLKVFEEAGMVGLSWYEGGVRSFYSARPIRTAADLQGMKIRVQESLMMQDMITLMGGVPMTTAYTDVYAAFQTGRIDAAENSWNSYYTQSHHRVAPYYTVDQHTRVPEVQLVSRTLWEALSEEYRQIILECARASALYERALWKEQEDASRQAALDSGAEEIELDGQTLRELKELATPLYEQYCGDYLDIIARIQAG